MGHPLRIQRQRKKGWRMPDDAVYVGRPSNWGNPFSTAAEFRTLLEAIVGISGQSDFHKTDLASFSRVYWIAQNVGHLRGKKLACWCGLDHDCHADAMAEIANRKEPQCCGVCRHFNEDPGGQFGWCRVKVPFWSARLVDYVWEKDGDDCPCFERKEGE